jgi:hypothetical protein
MFALLNVTVLLLTASPPAVPQPASIAACQPSGQLARVAELGEGSGVAPSKRLPGRFWSHNDSGEAVLFALDDKGTVVGRLELPGAKVDDWEAVAVGPCPGGSCIFVADIGDNEAKRRTIAIYRVPEPAEPNGSVKVTDVFHAKYPDGAHDAETLLAMPSGELLIVTKGETGPVAIYRFPRELESGATVELERVGKPRDDGNRAPDRRITDGAVSPNGATIALRSNADITLFKTDELLAGHWRETQRIPLASLGEPQGEGIAFANETTMYLVGEGGGKKQSGTFGRVTCAP